MLENQLVLNAKMFSTPYKIYEFVTRDIYMTIVWRCFGKFKVYEFTYH